VRRACCRAPSSPSGLALVAEDYRKWQQFGVVLAAALDGDAGTSLTFAGGSSIATGVSSKIQAVLTAAHDQLGLPYCWAAGDSHGPTYGGSGGNAPCAPGHPGFDCSGLMLYAYAQIGITLPHYTGTMFNQGHKIPRTQVRPGTWCSSPTRQTASTTSP
jgi:cell wall-associated NlpC family hydrolase